MRPLIRQFSVALLSMGFSACAFAQSIVCEGVLGNSGEQGTSLVRWASAPARGMGVVVDRQGFLWSRAGSGVLNRYALDGRLVRKFTIATGGNGNDQLTLVGDTLVMQINRQLYTLPISAAPTAQPKELKRQSDVISFGSSAGRIASVLDGQPYLLNIATGDATPVGSRVGQCRAVELDSSGTLYVQDGDSFQKIVDGKPVTEGGWPKGSPGERPQLLDNSWFGYAWHGTIRRFTAEMDPAPGVTLGGASGSFIGHLDEDPDLSSGRGMAKIADNLFAVSAINGNILVLSWDEPKQQFQIVRRIGAVSQCGGLAVDQKGAVWLHAGAWNWADHPAAALRPHMVPMDTVGQAVMLNGDIMVQPTLRYGQFSITAGRPSVVCIGNRLTGKPAIKDFAGTAVYRDSNRLVMLVIDKAGKAETLNLSPNGDSATSTGAVSVTPATAVKEWTSLATIDNNTMLAAADGQIIVLTRNGSDWREKARWNSWGKGPKEKFGAWIYVTADASRLWVSDRERHRVLCFDLKASSAGAQPITTFGTVDVAHDDTLGLARPQAIAAYGSRVVVFDSGNFRLLKLAVR